jgi:hypothetical protein
MLGIAVVWSFQVLIDNKSYKKPLFQLTTPMFASPTLYHPLSTVKLVNNYQDCHYTYYIMTSTNVSTTKAEEKVYWHPLESNPEVRSNIGYVRFDLLTTVHSFTGYESGKDGNWSAVR